MEVVANSNQILALVSYLVDFSVDNLHIISSLACNFEPTTIISKISSFYNSNKDFLNFPDDIESFFSMFSELLTFTFLSFYLLDSNCNYNQILSKFQCTPGLLFSDILNDYSVEDLSHFFNKLNFKNLFNYFENESVREVLSGSSDPFTFIYENFLAKYNKNLIKHTGLYYSPKEPVKFIVSSINDLLGDSLKNSEEIDILDPSCGTGLFLLAIIQVLHESFLKNNIRSKKLHLNGFDVNPVSYFLTIQNLRLFSNRKQVNTNLFNVSINNLSPITDLVNFKSNSLNSKYIYNNIESLKAVRERTYPFRIIFGNPPYSAVSNNSNNWINNLLKGKNGNESTHNYFEVAGVNINEKKSGWLYDDYVKFIRFGHWLIDKSDGILSYICNNGFLSNPSFRGMRFQLIETFNTFYILNLHGNRKIDNPPNNIKDENIFPITQGICLFLFIKETDTHLNDKKFFYLDFWGSKKEKLQFLNDNNIKTITWKQFSPLQPFYNFLPEDLEIKNLYSSFWSIKDIFLKKGTGLITSKDNLTLQFTKDELISTLKNFSTLEPETAREKFNLGADTENWKIKTAQKDIHEHDITDEFISTIVYRPFDVRYTFFTGKANGFHGRPKAISAELFHRDNIALVSARTNKTGYNDHFFVSPTLTEAKCAESSTQSYVFPLKTYNKDNEEFDNINKSFIKLLTSTYKVNYDNNKTSNNTINSLDILAYMYAIFYSNHYREIFKIFLFYDFPRVPLVSSVSLFKKLISIGHELLDLHLLNFFIPIDFTLNKDFKSGGKVKSIFFKDNKIFINKTDFFYPIESSTYNFTIGNYKILKKWLEGKKQRLLSTTNIEEFKKIVFAIQRTIQVVNSINELTKNNILLHQY